MAEVHCRDKRIILDTHVVVVLIALLKAPEDRDGLGGGRLVDHHFLETALQCLVLLKVLLVLVEGSATDGAKFAAGERRLEDVGRIHRAARAARAHQRMDLIDKQYHFPFAVDHFLDHTLEPLLELALVLGACDKRTHVQRINPSVLEVLGHLAGDYLLGYAFGNSGLADTRLTYQDRIVLGPSRQNLEDPSYLVIPADHGVKLTLCGAIVKIDGVFTQKFIFVLHSA